LWTATGVGVDVCNPQDSCFILTGKERTTTALFELSRLLQEYGQEPVHVSHSIQSIIVACLSYYSICSHWNNL